MCIRDSAYPYRAMTYARQMIVRESNITERSLVTRCELINSGVAGCLSMESGKRVGCLLS